MEYTVDIAFDPRKGSFGSRSSLVRRILEAHGGTVTFQQAESAGWGRHLSYCQYVTSAAFSELSDSDLDSLTRRVKSIQGIWVDAITCEDICTQSSRLYRSMTCQN